MSERVFHDRHSTPRRARWLDAEGPTSPALIDVHPAHDSGVRLLHLLQLSLLPRVSRRARGAGEGDPRADGRTRRRARALDLRADLPRRARPHVQLVRGARADPDAVRTTTTCPASSSVSARRFRRTSRPRRASGRSSTCAIGSRSTSAASTRTRAARSCSTTSSATRGMLAEGLHLVLIGNPIIPIPDHPKIHHLGFVNDQDKFDALAAAELLIMPSYFESLSMVALEAWALGKPVLANGRCDVLKGQCIRSNGGLYYDNFPRVHRDAARDRLHTRRSPARSAATAASTSTGTTPGRSSSGSISTCSIG